MPVCKNDKNANYKGDEPSPKGLGYCAHSEKVGTIMKGLDKSQWIITKTTTNIKRWTKLNIIKPGKKYYIHDNGSRPFMVVINKKNVYVYIVSNNKNYDKLILDITVKNIIIGKDGKHVDGNSILLQLEDNKYICITESIFTFELKNNDEFVKYFSIVGNSDVPYPVLLGKKYFYSMIDKTYGSRDEFPKEYKISDYAEGHLHYYGKWNGKIFVGAVKKWKLPKFKTLHKRIL